MPQKYFDENDQEVELPTPEEVKQIQEERDALVKEKADLLAEKERLEKGGADKDDNFVKFRTKLESTEKELADVNKRLSDKEQYEKTSTKNTLIDYYAGSDEDSRKKLEAEYAVINIAEDNPINIATRMEKAARVSGLYKEETAENPVFKGFYSGSAPHLKPSKPDGDDADNILNTDKGKGALNAMGVPTDEPKK